MREIRLYRCNVKYERKGGKVKNKKWGILLAVFSMMCMLAMSLTGFAAGPLDGQKVGESLLTSKSHVEDTRELVVEGSDVQPYGVYLSYGTAGLSDLGGGRVNFYGDTVCQRLSDTVKVDLYLQRLVGGNWITFTTRYCTTYNTYSASNGDYVTVPKGYYYRVKGVHTATKGNVTESTTSYTDGAYIG